jgi:hypothetical protein
MIPHRTTRSATAVHSLLLAILLFGTLLSGALAQEEPNAIEGEQAGQTVPPTDLGGNYIWTQWHPNQYSLAEDSEAIWIGAAGGVVRWDKNTQTHQRFMTPEGLPHQHVWAVAVDAAGNRWFGGDGGLSRLDTQNVWTHFTTENSGLFRNRVDAIAVGPDNTLWLSHDLSGGSVSRLNADGSWRWYPNHTAAVIMDYPLILQTVNANRLWTIAGDDVWVKYLVYNGSTWQNQAPFGYSYDPKALVATHAGVVVAVAEGIYAGYGLDLLRWQEGAWSQIYQPIRWTTLAVAGDDTVWGGGAFGSPRSNTPGNAVIAPIGGDATDVQVIYQTPPTLALLPAASQPWAMGFGWLRQPDGTVYGFRDVPYYPNVNDIWLGEDGLVHVHSEPTDGLPIHGLVEIVDDKGTAVLGDDEWQGGELISALYGTDRTPAGDLWIATAGGYPPIFHLVRQPQGASINIPWPANWSPFVTDIFAQDERRLWIACRSGVLMLDDGGTPLEVEDDTWTEYPFSFSTSASTVAVDELGRLWYGNNRGLYHYTDGQWQLLPSDRDVNPAICDLIPAKGGVLFANIAGADRDCEVRSELAMIVWPDFTMNETGDVRSLAATYRDLVRSATHRNRLWTVTPDGDIWFVYTSEKPYGTTLYFLGHYGPSAGPSGATMYGVPFPSESVRAIEVDANGHVWVVAESTLWRLSLRPDFDIPSISMLLAPGLTRQQVSHVRSIEGYHESIQLAVSGLPLGLTAQIEPDTVPAGAGFTLTVMADPAVELGTYTAELIGVSAGGVHTQTLTLVVMAEIHDSFLPVVNR